MSEFFRRKVLAGGGGLLQQRFCPAKHLVYLCLYFVFVFVFVFVSAFVSVFVSVFVFVFVAEPCCSGSVLQNISLSDMFQFTPGPSIRVVKTLKAQQRFFVKCRLQNGPTICYRHQV